MAMTLARIGRSMKNLDMSYETFGQAPSSVVATPSPMALRAW